jgi:hypothetical protein
VRIGEFPGGKTMLSVKVTKMGGSIWSHSPVPHNGWVQADEAGVRRAHSTSEPGYPGLWVDLGWRGLILGIEGIDLEGD